LERDARTWAKTELRPSEDASAPSSRKASRRLHTCQPELELALRLETFIVCGAVGLDTSGSSVPYVAGWGESGELDAIRGYAETIDKIARRIEDSLPHESQVSQQQASLAA
jgi:hypothetical protein